MALQDIVTVSVTLEGTGVSRTGFGTPIFISSYRAFDELVRSYSSLTEVGVDFPTTSSAYAAATSFFSQEPAPPIIKIGRRESNAIFTITLQGATPGTPIGTITSFLITVNDGDSAVVTYTTVALNEDAETIVGGLITNLATHTEVSAHVTGTKIGSGGAATLQISATLDADVFTITEDQNVNTTFQYTPVGTASAAQTLQDIEEVDEDFYFVTADDHTSEWVTGMAAAVEARDKLYFVSNGEADAYTGTVEPYVDIVGVLFAGNYFRTICIWNQEADTKFTECAFVGYNAPFDAGTPTWNGLRLAGVAVSSSISTGLKLTTAQKNVLSNKNCNFVDSIGGAAATREGKSVAGEWIDNLRGRDAVKIRMTEDLQNLIINQQGGKIPYTNPGINQVRSTMNTRLQTFVDSGFLASFSTSLPDIRDVPDIDRQNRILNNAEFEGILASAIHIIVVQGSLVY